MWGSIVCACLLQAVGPASAGLPPELTVAEVRAVEVDGEGTVWVGVRDAGLVKLSDGEFRSESSAMLPEGIADLLFGRSGLWAVGLGGVARRSGGSWQTVELPNAPRVVFSVTPGGADETLWFGTNRGAVALEAGEWTVVSEDDGLPHAVVHQVLVDGDGSVWFLCRRGLARLDDGVLQVFHPDLNFRRGIVGPDGLPWFGTSAGLLRWNGASFEVELDGVVPYPLALGPDESLWAGSASDGVLRYVDGGWSEPLPELAGVEVFDIATDGDGAVWIASQIGLRRVITVEPR